MASLTKEEARSATNEELAQVVLDCSDGRLISNAFMATAAIELANRILSLHSQPIKEPAVAWGSRAASGGKARARRTRSTNYGYKRWGDA